MCDEADVIYKPGDIVWFKFSSVWWPAEVQDQDKLDREVTGGLKKRPLAVVKFFDEDSYEFVRNLDQIYFYTCPKKIDFIKQGLEKCRPGNHKSIPTCMKKFQPDIEQAEIRTGGDPNILQDPIFQPEQKPDVDYSNLFASATPKYKPKKRASNSITSVDNDTPPAKIAVRPKASAADSADKVIKYIACDISSTMSSRHQASNGLSSLYACDCCPFTTTRLSVINLHCKTCKPTAPLPYFQMSHSSGLSTPKTPKKKKKVFQLSSNKGSVAKVTKKVVKKTKAESVKPPRLSEKDIREGILKDWEDDDEEESVPNDSNEATPADESSANKLMEVLADSEEEKMEEDKDSNSEEVIIDGTVDEKDLEEDLKTMKVDEQVVPDSEKEMEPPEKKDEENDEPENESKEDDDLTQKITELLESTETPEIPAFLEGEKKSDEEKKKSDPPEASSESASSGASGSPLKKKKVRRTSTQRAHSIAAIKISEKSDENLESAGAAATSIFPSRNKETSGKSIAVLDPSGHRTSDLTSDEMKNDYSKNEKSESPKSTNQMYYIDEVDDIVQLEKELECYEFGAENEVRAKHDKRLEVESTSSVSPVQDDQDTLESEGPAELSHFKTSPTSRLSPILSEEREMKTPVKKTPEAPITRSSLRLTPRVHLVDCVLDTSSINRKTCVDFDELKKPRKPDDPLSKSFLRALREVTEEDDKTKSKEDEPKRATETVPEKYAAVADVASPLGTLAGAKIESKRHSTRNRGIISTDTSISSVRSVKKRDDKDEILQTRTGSKNENDVKADLSDASVEPSHLRRSRRSSSKGSLSSSEVEDVKVKGLHPVEESAENVKKLEKVGPDEATTVKATRGSKRRKNDTVLDMSSPTVPEDQGELELKNTSGNSAADLITLLETDSDKEGKDSNSCPPSRKSSRLGLKVETPSTDKTSLPVKGKRGKVQPQSISDLPSSTEKSDGIVRRSQRHSVTASTDEDGTAVGMKKRGRQKKGQREITAANSERDEAQDSKSVDSKETTETHKVEIQKAEEIVKTPAVRKGGRLNLRRASKTLEDSTNNQASDKIENTSFNESEEVKRTPVVGKGRRAKIANDFSTTKDAEESVESPTGRSKKSKANISPPAKHLTKESEANQEEISLIEERLQSPDLIEESSKPVQSEASELEVKTPLAIRKGRSKKPIPSNDHATDYPKISSPPARSSRSSDLKRTPLNAKDDLKSPESEKKGAATNKSGPQPEELSTNSHGTSIELKKKRLSKKDRRFALVKRIREQHLTRKKLKEDAKIQELKSLEGETHVLEDARIEPGKDDGIEPGNVEMVEGTQRCDQKDDKVEDSEIKKDITVSPPKKKGKEAEAIKESKPTTEIKRTDVKMSDELKNKDENKMPEDPTRVNKRKSDSAVEPPKKLKSELTTVQPVRIIEEIDMFQEKIKPAALMKSDPGSIRKNIEQSKKAKSNISVLRSSRPSKDSKEVHSPRSDSNKSVESASKVKDQLEKKPQELVDTKDVTLDKSRRASTGKEPTNDHEKRKTRSELSKCEKYSSKDKETKIDKFKSKAAEVKRTTDSTESSTQGDKEKSKAKRSSKEHASESQPLSPTPSKITASPAETKKPETVNNLETRSLTPTKSPLVATDPVKSPIQTPSKVKHVSKDPRLGNRTQIEETKKEVRLSEAKEPLSKDTSTKKHEKGKIKFSSYTERLQAKAAEDKNKEEIRSHTPPLPPDLCQRVDFKEKSSDSGEKIQPRVPAVDSQAVLVTPAKPQDVISSPLDMVQQILLAAKSKVVGTMAKANVNDLTVTSMSATKEAPASNTPTTTPPKPPLKLNDFMSSEIDSVPESLKEEFLGFLSEKSLLDITKPVETLAKAETPLEKEAESAPEPQLLPTRDLELPKRRKDEDIDDALETKLPSRAPKVIKFSDKCFESFTKKDHLLSPNKDAVRPSTPESPRTPPLPPLNQVTSPLRPKSRWSQSAATPLVEPDDKNAEAKKSRVPVEVHWGTKSPVKKTPDFVGTELSDVKRKLSSEVVETDEPTPKITRVQELPAEMPPVPPEPELPPAPPEDAPELPPAPPEEPPELLSALPVDPLELVPLPKEPPPMELPSLPSLSLPPPRKEEPLMNLPDDFKAVSGKSEDHFSSQTETTSWIVDVASIPLPPEPAPPTVKSLIRTSSTEKIEPTESLPPVETLQKVELPVEAEKKEIQITDIAQMDIVFDDIPIPASPPPTKASPQKETAAEDMAVQATPEKTDICEDEVHEEQNFEEVIIENPNDWVMSGENEIVIGEASETVSESAEVKSEPNKELPQTTFDPATMDFDINSMPVVYGDEFLTDLNAITVPTLAAQEVVETKDVKDSPASPDPSPVVEPKKIRPEVLNYYVILRNKTNQVGDNIFDLPRPEYKPETREKSMKEVSSRHHRHQRHHGSSHGRHHASSHGHLASSYLSEISDKPTSPKVPIPPGKLFIVANASGGTGQRSVSTNPPPRIVTVKGQLQPIEKPSKSLPIAKPHAKALPQGVLKPELTKVPSATPKATSKTKPAAATVQIVAGKQGGPAKMVIMSSNKSVTLGSLVMNPSMTSTNQKSREMLFVPSTKSSTALSSLMKPSPTLKRVAATNVALKPSPKKNVPIQCNVAKTVAVTPPAQNTTGAQIMLQIQPTISEANVEALNNLDQAGADGTDQVLFLAMGDQNSPILTIDNSQQTFLQNADQSNNLIILRNSGEVEPTKVGESGHDDILAKALANTQVLQSDSDLQSLENAPVYIDEQYPIASLSHNVLETSLTLNQPIMTPIEQPSIAQPTTSNAAASHVSLLTESDLSQAPVFLATSPSGSQQPVTFHVISTSSNVVSTGQTQLIISAPGDSSKLTSSTLLFGSLQGTNLNKAQTKLPPLVSISSKPVSLSSNLTSETVPTMISTATPSSTSSSHVDQR